MLQDAAESLGTVAVKVAVSNVEHRDLSVRLEDWHQDHEVLASDIVLTDVKIYNSISVFEGQSEMLETKAIVEELVEVGLLEFVLVAKLNLQHVSFIYISVADHVLGQVDGSQAGVILQDL